MRITDTVLEPRACYSGQEVLEMFGIVTHDGPWHGGGPGQFPEPDGFDNHGWPYWQGGTLLALVRSVHRGHAPECVRALPRVPDGYVKVRR